MKQKDVAVVREHGRVCEEAEEAQKKDDAQREKAIKQALKEKDAWQCTCRKKTDPNRFLHHHWHGEKCTLYSGKVGEEDGQGRTKASPPKI